MRSAIFIDLQSTVFDSHTYYLRLLNKLIEKNKWKVQLPHYVQYQLLDFYQLYFQFIKINRPFTKMMVYLKEQNNSETIHLYNKHYQEPTLCQVQYQGPDIQKWLKHERDPQMV